MNWKKEQTLKTLLLEYRDEVAKRQKDLEQNPNFNGHIKLEQVHYKRLLKRNKKRLQFLDDLIELDCYKKRE